VSDAAPISIEIARWLPFSESRQGRVVPSRKPEKGLMKWLGWTQATPDTTVSTAAVKGLILTHTPLQKSADVTSEIEGDLSYVIALGILIPQPSELRQYFLAHPDVLDVIVAVCEDVHHKFAAPTQLSLEVYEDPEIEDKYPTLYVRQAQYDENLLRQLKKSRSDYEQMLRNKSGWFLLTTDFRPPKH
jgi:hypothetical protein